MKKLLFFASAVAMLASCSQDLTEDVVAPAPSFEGNSSIIASYNMGDETRTSLGEAVQVGTQWKKTYVWDEADALGVFAYAKDDKTNATFKFIKMVDEYSAQFKGSYEFIETDKYIVYYPYNQAGYNTGTNSAMEALSVLDGMKVRLSIPATQLFNFDATAQKGEHAGSFSQNTAPSIGIGEINEDGQLVVKMKGAASYIYFPIKGTGFIKTLELSISGVDHLNGYNQVLVDTADPDFGFKAPSKNGSATTILNCGVKGVKLDPEKATNFWFVVPNLTLKDATITVKVNGNEDLKLVRNNDYTSKTATGAWLANEFYRIFDVDANGTANTPWYIDVPAEDDDDFIIDNEYKFLEYAYAATEGKNIPAVMLNGSNLKAGKIVTDLNFEGFTFAAEGSAFRKAVAAWYNEAEGVIPTIGGAKAFSIVGAVEPEVAAAAEAEEETPATVAPATIKGLKVTGALFDDADGKSYTNAVENIVLEGLTVTNSEYILANRVYKGTGTITISKVTIDTCEAPEGAAVIGRAFTNTLANTITNKTNYVSANELNIMEDYDLADLPEDFKYNGVIVNRSTSAGAPANGKIVTVADATAAADFIKAVTETTPGKSGQKADWYSVTDGTTFYYTGTAATALRADDVITAEEFAFLTTKEGIATVKDNTYELTNSINMMGAEIEATAKTATVTVKEGANVTISNVTVKSAFLLAETGTATGVNVEATYTATGYVGGLFFEADVEKAGTTTACVVTADAAAAEKFGTYYAKVYLTLGTKTTTKLSANFVGENAPYGAIVCKASPTEKLEGEYTNIYFDAEDYTKEQLKAIADRIEWEWAENAQIPDGYYLQLISGNTTVTSDPFEFKVTNDDALKYAIGKAKTGETVTVEPGTYTELPKPAAEGVIIDAEGAVLTDVLGKGTTANDLDLNGGKLIGAEFYTESNMYNTTSNGIISGTFENCKFIGDNAYSGLYAYHTEENKPVIFTNCEFTANTTVAQVYADKATVTYEGCTFNGYVSIAGAVGTTVKDCHFKVGPTNFAGANVWAKTSFDGCKFYFQEYDPEKEKELGLANTFQFIAPVKQTNAADTIEFTNCQVYDSNNAFTRMTAEFEFRVPATQEGVVVKVNGKDVTLHKNVLD